MKITIELSDEKRSALEMYLAQKGTSLEAELTKYTEQLYAKTVPQNVRDFIGMVGERKPPRKPKTAPKSKPEPPDEL